MLSLMMRENKDESGFVPSPRSSRASGGDEACVQNVRQDVSPAIKEGIRIKATVCKAPPFARPFMVHFIIRPTIHEVVLTTTSTLQMKKRRLTELVSYPQGKSQVLLPGELRGRDSHRYKDQGDLWEEMGTL